MDAHHALVVAPAGFGKSTLLAAMLQARLKAGGTSAWATLGEDDDPAAFMALVRSTFVPIDTLPGTAVTSISGGLLDRIAHYDGSLALFLDDADRAPVATRRVVADLIRDAPPQLQIVIAARDSGGMALAKLRTAGALHVVDAVDLRLDAHDLAELGTGLSRRDLLRLRDTSGGWPVAAALLAEGWRANGAAARLAYEDIGLFDYIEQEVVVGLGEEEDKVLTACALLDQITSAASARITSLPRAPEHLARAARKLPGLIDRVEDQETGYRLSPVLQAFFVARLLSAEPAFSTHAVEQSCTALARQGLVAEAVRIAQDAHRSDLALVLIEDRGAIAMWLTVGIDEVREVLRFAGVGLVAAHPRLQLMSAIVSLKAGRLPEAERLYDGAQAAWPEGMARWELSVVRLALLVYGCRTPTAADLAVFRDLAAQTRVDPTWRTFVDSAVCILQIENGEFEAASVTAAATIAGVGASELPYAALFLNYHLAAISASRGDTRRAREMLRSGRAILKAQFSKDRGAETIGVVQTAELDYEVGHLSAARMRLRSMSADLHQMEGWFDIYAAAFATAARVMQHDLGLAAAREHLRTTGEALRRKNLERVADHLLVVDRLLVGEALLNGGIDVAAEPLSLPTAPSRSQGWREFEADKLAAAYWALADRRGAEVLKPLDELIGYATRRGALRPQLRALLLKAVALEQGDEEELAYECFLQALSLGGRTAFRRSFLDFGGVANRERLRRAAESGDGEEARFAASLLPQLRQHTAGRETLRLTPREHEVLSGLESGASDKMLGRRLGVSEHAVRFHLKNIFLKLQVHTRVEAISRARRLQLSDPT